MSSTRSTRTTRIDFVFIRSDLAALNTFWKSVYLERTACPSIEVQAMPAYWMITDRDLASDLLGLERGPQTYWVSDGAAPLGQLSSWTQVTADEFQAEVVAAASQFPLIEDPALHEDQ